jgi:AcrR family transcriptional regulator
MSSKWKILECAERLVVREGVARLTLDAVAAEAGLSKGGVLYNFRTKDALIRGMVEHLIEASEAAITRSIETDPNPKGRFTRALLAVNFPEPKTEAEHHNQVAAAMLAAILTNPDLLEPLREVYRGVSRQLANDGIDPVRAHMIQLAGDGLWLSEMLGMPGPEPERRRALLARLYELTRE